MQGPIQKNKSNSLRKARGRYPLTRHKEARVSPFKGSEVAVRPHPPLVPHHVLGDRGQLDAIHPLRPQLLTLLRHGRLAVESEAAPCFFFFCVRPWPCFPNMAWLPMP